MTVSVAVSFQNTERVQPTSPTELAKPVMFP